MKPVLPENITCRVTCSGNPIQGVMLWVELKTRRKNPYCVSSGLTDVEGQVSISRKEIEVQAMEQLKFALMDYMPLDDSFAGMIEVSICNQDEINKALEGYELFREYTNYPVNYKEDLLKAKENLSCLPLNAKLELEVEVFPHCIQVVTKRR